MTPMEIEHTTPDKRYLHVFYIENGTPRENFFLEINSKSNDIERENEIFQKLKERYPYRENILVEGYKGFKYISNFSHWAAAAYPPEVFESDYMRGRAPAHFNPPFFHIVR